MNNFYKYPYYRSSLPHTPPVAQNVKPLVPPQKTVPPPKPKPPKKKFDFKSFKKNTCTSLNDVECFLNNFSTTWKYIKLIKLLK